jgi:four helix bundle protein
MYITEEGVYPLFFEEKEFPYSSKNEKTRSFEGLQAWQNAHSFVLEVYRLTVKFPSEEKFGLVSQLRRAAVSIAANITEGSGKKSIRDIIRFFIISRGSVQECHYYLILAKDLAFLPPAEFSSLKEKLDQTGKLLNGLINSLEKKIPPTLS